MSDSDLARCEALPAIKPWFVALEAPQGSSLCFDLTCRRKLLCHGLNQLQVHEHTFSHTNITTQRRSLAISLPRRSLLTDKRDTDNGLAAVLVPEPCCGACPAATAASELHAQTLDANGYTGMHVFTGTTLENIKTNMIALARPLKLLPYAGATSRLLTADPQQHW